MDNRLTLGRFAGFVALALLLIAAAWAMWRIAALLFIVFGGVVLSLPLSRLAHILGRWTHLPYRPALAGVATLLLIAAGLGIWGFGTQIAGLYGEFQTALTSAFREAGNALRNFHLGRVFLEELQQVELASIIPGGVLSSVTGFASTVVTAMSSAILLVVIALYFAFDPLMYRRGVEALAPPSMRHRWSSLMSTVATALWGWMRGQLISMAIIGALTTAMLWGLGVPMAIPLGIIAFFFEFVPFIGPIAAALPGLLIAFTQGTDILLWALLGYVLIQQVENNVVMPIVYQNEVYLPPVLTVAATVAFGLLFGLVGLLFATPVVVAAFAASRCLLRWRDEAASVRPSTPRPAA